MADTYVVTANINSYSKASVTSNVVQKYTKGSEVKIYSTSNGWGNTTALGSKWVKMSYLKKVASGTSKAEDGAKENEDVAENDTVYGTSSSDYNKLLYKYIRAFGSPPRFTKYVDPIYNEKLGYGTGRAMGNTWYSDPAILSICPGTVDYLPGFSKSEKNKFWDRVRDSMSDSVKSLAEGDLNTDLNGKLYAFKSSYNSYINVVNLLARTAADFLGIGNVKDIIYKSKIPLNKFDYGFWTDPSKSSSNKSIFAETVRSLNTAVSDSSYVHFFINHAGVTTSDNFTTESGKSWLESQFDTESGLSSVAQNIQFLFGGAITPEAESDIANILQEARDESEFLGSMTTMASNYLKGGRLVFPKMITGMDYEKTIQVQLSFTSIYGDKRSIFKYTILPALHLLALASPLQLSDNMYTYPYLVRIYERGNVNCDLAYLSNLEFSRGGSDNTSWTVDGLPTEITASFSVTPLYSNMMVTSSRNPFLFMQNTALLEYLGTMCGLDLKANNLEVKVQLAKQLLSNYVSDTPTNLARGIVDSKLIQEIRKYTQIIN